MAKTLLFLTALGYTIALIVVSFISIDGVPSLGSDFDDKIYHGIAYLLLSFLWGLYSKFKPIKFRYVRVIISTILFGIIIESLQHKINPNRVFDLNDIAANCLGVLLGTLFAVPLNVNKLN